MSRYPYEPVSFEKLRTIPLAERGGKVTTAHFAKPIGSGSTVEELLDSLPHLLAADSLRAIVAAIHEARRRDRAVIFAMGGHVIKCGLAPILIDLAKRGLVTAFAMNGSAAIHDFEIALAGQTSEDVEAVLPDGQFGSAEETGREMNNAIRPGLGWGEALGERLGQIAMFPSYSLLHQAYALNVPVTIHAAIGTDTPHTHPAANGAAIGAATHHDFRLFCTLVTRIHAGGVFVNLGSAVVMPEVFLKAISAVRNLGHPLSDFTTANFDFIQHYRPTQNVVHRPHANAGGRGYAITGHHELMIPLLGALLANA